MNYSPICKSTNMLDEKILLYNPPNKISIAAKEDSNRWCMSMFSREVETNLHALWKYRFC